MGECTTSRSVTERLPRADSHYGSKVSIPNPNSISQNGDSRGTAVLSGSVVDLGGQAVAVGRHDKNYAVATMDRALASYSIKGRRVKTLATAGDIADFCFISVKKAKVPAIFSSRHTPV